MPLQPDLFADPAPPVPGLALVENVVDERAGRDLAARIDAVPLAPFKFGQWTGKRLTCSFGSGYDYQKGALTEAPPLPDWLATLRDRLAPQAGLDPARVAQALVIRYDPGAGIGWHRDRPQYDEVMGLSLGAPCVLRLRRHTGEGFERRSLHLPPGSLYRLSGEVRWEWEHSIVPMDVTRRSITFRTLR